MPQRNFSKELNKFKRMYLVFMSNAEKNIKQGKFEYEIERMEEETDKLLECLEFN